jgi:hypothetical protein
MSENGYATKDALQTRRGKRRFKEYQWADVGLLDLQSPMASEFIAISAARQRATTAAMSGKKKEQESATQDFVILVLTLIPLDKERNHFFTVADKDLILSLDSSLVDQLVDACMAHADLDSVSVGDAQKNLPPTSGVATPTGSGST